MTEYFKSCTKCYGTGRYAARRSGFVGKCFACYGTGRTFISKKHKAAYKAEKAKKAASWFETNKRWLVGVSFLYAATGNPIARSVCEWGLRGRPPTEKMLVAVYKAFVRALIKFSSPPEPSAPVVEGKGVVLSGEVVSLKERHNGYDYVWKMLVKESRGFKVWGTVPKAIVEEVEKGSKVSFVANVKASNDDECFGFFSRPRKAALAA